ncbi:MAG: DNA polymerase III subunit delta' [Desulfobacteraceae bacterium]
MAEEAVRVSDEEVPKAGPFSAVLGQERAIGFLRRALAEGKIPNAYLFSGITGAGKTTTALAFARALNCSACVDGESCGECVSCRRMAGGNHPDLEMIRPKGRTIGIEQMRELARRIFLKTVVPGGYRVSIIERAEWMTQEAANAFLKTLEEPPPGNVMILCVADQRELPSTIESRCQRVPFAPVSPEVLSRWLIQTRELPELEASILAGLSGGSVGRALLMAEGGLVERRLKDLEEFLALPRMSPFEILETAVGYAKEEKKQGGQESVLWGVMDLWKSCCRDLVLIHVGAPEGLIVNKDKEEELRALADKCNIKNLAEILLILDKAQRELSESRNIDLLAETTFLRLCSEARGTGTDSRSLSERFMGSA